MMKKKKGPVIDGERTLKGRGVSKRRKGRSVSGISATNIVLDTGARAREFPGLKRWLVIWTYSHAHGGRRNLKH